MTGAVGFGVVTVATNLAEVAVSSRDGGLPGDGMEQGLDGHRFEVPGFGPGDARVAG